MKLCLIVILLGGTFLFSKASFAQATVESMESNLEAPTLMAEPGGGPVPGIFSMQNSQPAPPPMASQGQGDPGDARRTQDLYRGEIKEFAKNRHQFVHCKLKNGKIVTGTVRAPGYEAFTLKTHVLGEGKYIYYSDLAEPPQSVAAVGTRFKLGAEWTGLGILAAVGLPVLIILSPFLYASGWDC
ncbi:MAG: hypothetical protein JSS69_15315 [Acidobacteria bacterium]|nr:hypothetical protein [Acidobacteriota bacterium]MBS1867282.1 hypothetical protein [Acidobacteriota bacterium]